MISHFLAFYGPLYGLGDGLVGVNFRTPPDFGASIYQKSRAFESKATLGEVWGGFSTDDPPGYLSHW